MSFGGIRIDEGPKLDTFPGPQIVTPLNEVQVSKVRNTFTLRW